MLNQKPSVLLKTFLLALSIGYASDGYGSAGDAIDNGGGLRQRAIPAADCSKINQCSPHVGFGPAPCDCKPPVAGGKGLCPASDCTTKCKPPKHALVYWQASDKNYKNPVWGQTHMSIPASCALKCKDKEQLEVYLDYGAPSQEGNCARKFPVTKFRKKQGSDKCFSELKKCIGKGIHVEVRRDKDTAPSGHFNYGTLSAPY